MRELAIFTLLSLFLLTTSVRVIDRAPKFFGAGLNENTAIDPDGGPVVNSLFNLTENENAPTDLLWVSTLKSGVAAMNKTHLVRWGSIDQQLETTYPISRKIYNLVGDGNGIFFVVNRNLYAWIGSDASPIFVDTETSPVDIFSNGDDTFYVDASGRYYGLGLNTNGILGLGHSNAVTEFTQIESIRDARLFAVNVVGSMAVAIMDKNEIWVSGNTSHLPLSTSQPSVSKFTLSNEYSGSRITKLGLSSGSASFIPFLNSDGEVHFWGDFEGEFSTDNKIQKVEGVDSATNIFAVYKGIIIVEKSGDVKFFGIPDSVRPAIADYQSMDDAVEYTAFQQQFPDDLELTSVLSNPKFTLFIFAEEPYSVNGWLLGVLIVVLACLVMVGLLGLLVFYFITYMSSNSSEVKLDEPCKELESMNEVEINEEPIEPIKEEPIKEQPTNVEPEIVEEPISDPVVTPQSPKSHGSARKSTVIFWDDEEKKFKFIRPT